MVRLGVVGAGIWGTMHARAYAQHPSAELVAVCDLDEVRARELAEKSGGARYFTDLDAMLREDLDGISVATPDAAHCEIVLKAAARGVHILVEKPLATTVEECRKMVDAAEEAGVFLMVDWHNRWNPNMAYAFDSIRAGELGDVRYIYYRLSDTVYVPRTMLPWAGESSVVWFLGSHALDTTCWLIGKRPVRIYCQKRWGVLQSMGVDTPDLNATMLEFEDGALAVLENTWIVPQEAPALIDHRVEILGSRGAVYLDGTHNRGVAKYTPESVKGYPEPVFPDMLVCPEVHGRQMGFAVESIYHFVECIRDSIAPMTTGQDGLLNTRLILAAEESAEKGVPVEIES